MSGHGECGFSEHSNGRAPAAVSGFDSGHAEAGASRATPGQALWALGDGATLKRVVDVLVALTALTLLAIPLALIAIAIKLDSRGPVFYRVRRVGYRGRPLLMLKFRKMRDHATGIPLTADQDSRFTRVGGVLARTRLDELPQLWDVLCGRMSLIGPRPEDPAFVGLHQDAYERIVEVRPGITGLSQLAFATEHKILDQSDLISDYVNRILPQKIGLDTLYCGSYRPKMDMSILGWTLAAIVLRRQVAVHRSTGALTLRRRPASATTTTTAAVVDVNVLSAAATERVADAA